MNQETAKRTFAGTFDTYADAIFRFCMVKTGNKELSEDLTQETFLRYWQGLRDGREMTNTRSYLYTIANNLVIDWYRKKKSESLDVRLEKGFEPQEKSGVDAEVESAYLEALSAMEDLDEQDRTVLLLRFVEGFEPRDISEILGESANAVSVRINRATKRLQQRLRI